MSLRNYSERVMDGSQPAKQRVSGLHHGGRAPQTPVGDAPRVLVVAAVRRGDVVGWRLDDDQVDGRRRRRATAWVSTLDRRRRAGLVSRPHHGDDSSCG